MVCCFDADYNDVFKLLSDLFDYYELNCTNMYGEDKYKAQYQKCKILIQREHGLCVKVDTPAIECVSRDYIKSIVVRANREIDNGDFDSAITKSRTLHEEVFCHAIEAKGEMSSDEGDIGKLYNQVKTLYNIHQSPDVDKRIN